MPNIEQAIAIAASAHAGYLGNDGRPYIFHPLRVMLRFQEERDQIVAVLHDVVEKTRWTVENLRSEGFSEDILEALDSVTRRQEEEYMAFVKRSCANAIGRRVKIADLKDNIETAKTHPSEKVLRDKLAKYEEALAVLE